MPDVNRNVFHIPDPDRGHITIKIRGRPLVPVQVMVNGHAYRAKEINFTRGELFYFTEPPKRLA